MSNPAASAGSALSLRIGQFKAANTHAVSSTSKEASNWYRLRALQLTASVIASMYSTIQHSNDELHVMAECGQNDLRKAEVDLNLLPKDGIGNISSKLEADTQIYKSVLKIFIEIHDPNFLEPWKTGYMFDRAPTAFVIEGRRLLTNAHVTANTTRLLLMKPGDYRRYPAHVEAVSHDCDLALLSVDNEEFWKDLKPLKLGGLPRLQDEVVVAGYPTAGGDNLSLTAGVVSRVAMRSLPHARLHVFCAEVDAAINGGNSGGPVVSSSDNSVVGVSAAMYVGGRIQNVGFIVTSSCIRRFLAGAKRGGNSLDFVVPNFTYQTTANPFLRKSIGLDNIDASKLPEGITASGILVKDVDEVNNEKFRKSNPTKSNVGLKKGDVILSFNGIDVGQDGTVFLRCTSIAWFDGNSSKGHERVAFEYVMTDLFPGDSVPALVLRENKLMTVTVPLDAYHFLVPKRKFDTPPQYLIYGGLAFLPLNPNYIEESFHAGRRQKEKAFPLAELMKLENKFQSIPNEEAIILSNVCHTHTLHDSPYVTHQIFPSSLTVGYQMEGPKRLLKVDGVSVDNMLHLIRILGQNAENQFVEFELQDGTKIVLDGIAVKKQTPEILKKFGIAKSCSGDLKSFVDEAKLI